MVVVDGEVGVGEGLRLDPLRCIDDEEGALACGKTATDFIREVDVAGRVDQVENVGASVSCPIGKADRLRLDGDAALALDIHRIEHLRTHLALAEGAANFDQTVGEGRFAVINMGDDGKVADAREIRHAAACSIRQWLL